MYIVIRIFFEKKYIILLLNTKIYKFERGYEATEIHYYEIEWVSKC